MGGQSYNPKNNRQIEVKALIFYGFSILFLWKSIIFQKYIKFLKKFYINYE